MTAGTKEYEVFLSYPITLYAMSCGQKRALVSAGYALSGTVLLLRSSKGARRTRTYVPGRHATVGTALHSTT